MSQHVSAAVAAAHGRTCDAQLLLNCSAVPLEHVVGMLTGLPGALTPLWDELSAPLRGVRQAFIQ